MQSSNKTFSLNDVASVEAWYERFTEDKREAEFFLHIRFQDAFFGNDPTHPVRFKLRLKQAEVVVIAEDPLKIPKKSVKRDRIRIEAERTVTTEGAQECGGEVSVELDASTTMMNAGVKASGKYEKTRAHKDNESYSITHSGMYIEHSVDREQNNLWSFKPALGTHLLGHVFNDNIPLMNLRHETPLSKIPPVVKVRVRCRREDIDILELEVKAEKKTLLHRGMGAEKKLKLAEEIIKDSLAHAGLEFEDLAEKFSNITVADVIATEE